MPHPALPAPHPHLTRHAPQVLWRQGSYPAASQAARDCAALVTALPMLPVPAQAAQALCVELVGVLVGLGMQALQAAGSMPVSSAAAAGASGGDGAGAGGAAGGGAGVHAARQLLEVAHELAEHGLACYAEQGPAQREGGGEGGMAQGLERRDEGQGGEMEAEVGGEGCDLQPTLPRRFHWCRGARLPACASGHGPMPPPPPLVHATRRRAPRGPARPWRSCARPRCCGWRCAT